MAMQLKRFRASLVHAVEKIEDAVWPLLRGVHPRWWA
jgi:hypothetical protein